TTVSKISHLLVPQEYTRLDGIIDLVFSTAEDVATPELEPDDDEDVAENGVEKKEPKFVPVGFHDKCAERIENHFSISLIKESKTMFKASAKDERYWIAVSKAHESNQGLNYWFAFHPHQKERLENAEKGCVVLGCGSEQTLLLIPSEVIINHLDDTWITQKEDR